VTAYAMGRTKERERKRESREKKEREYAQKCPLR